MPKNEWKFGYKDKENEETRKSKKKPQLRESITMCLSTYAGWLTDNIPLIYLELEELAANIKVLKEEWKSLNREYKPKKSKGNS